VVFGHTLAGQFTFFALQAATVRPGNPSLNISDHTLRPRRV
jgi:hypothetical protein